jgi:hypothetical protein
MRNRVFYPKEKVGDMNIHAQHQDKKIDKKTPVPNACVLFPNVFAIG